MQGYGNFGGMWGHGAMREPASILLPFFPPGSGAWVTVLLGRLLDRLLGRLGGEFIGNP